MTVLALLSLLVLVARHNPETDADYAEARDQAIKSLAAAFADDPEGAGRLIREVVPGYPPAAAASHFDALDAQDKFTAVVDDAERGGGQESGEAVLAKLSQALARIKEGAKHVEALDRFLRHDPAGTKIKLPPDSVQRIAERAKRAEDRTVKALTWYTTKGRSNADAVLMREVNFPPAGASPLYAGLSDQQKFKAALDAARREGGQKRVSNVLSKLSIAIARENEAARDDPDLARWHGFDRVTKQFRATPDAPPIRLASFEPLSVPALSRAQLGSVERLGRYLIPARQSPVEFLMWNFGLSDKQATNLLIRTTSFEEAVGHGVAGLPPGKQAAWFNQTAEHISKTSEVARKDPKIIALKTPPSVAKPSPPPSPPKVPFFNWFKGPKTIVPRR